MYKIYSDIKRKNYPSNNICLFSYPRRILILHHRKMKKKSKRSKDFFTGAGLATNFHLLCLIKFVCCEKLNLRSPKITETFMFRILYSRPSNGLFAQLNHRFIASRQLMRFKPISNRKSLLKNELEKLEKGFEKFFQFCDLRHQLYIEAVSR